MRRHARLSNPSLCSTALPLRLSNVSSWLHPISLTLATDCQSAAGSLQILTPPPLSPRLLPPVFHPAGATVTSGSEAGASGSDEGSESDRH